jgi:hypothetical protein
LAQKLAGVVGGKAIVGWRCSRRRPDSDYVVAQTLNVDGGNWMS